jgi:hypothetical protein
VPLKALTSTETDSFGVLEEEMQVISPSVGGPTTGHAWQVFAKKVCESIGGYRTTMVTRSGGLNRRSKHSVMPMPAF